MSRRVLCACLLVLASVLVPAEAQADHSPIPHLAARDAEPVVMTGADLPQWSRLPAAAPPNVWPQGADGSQDPSGNFDDHPFEGERDAHAAEPVVPPNARTGASPGEIAAYAWEDGWKEVPVQVDERYPYVLSNPNSNFSVYSARDEELTYAWDEESWKKTGGECQAEYLPGDGPEPDPVATLDDDDELVFMADDAGDRAPEGQEGPVGTRPGTPAQPTRQEIALADPLDPANVRYVYLFLQPDGSSFDPSNGYVRYERDPDADEWIDRYTFASDDPEKLGTGNTNYGPNLSGTVCTTDPSSFGRFGIDAGDAPRPSTDRFPRDGVTVSTDAYQWYASGRWMIREMHVAKPGQPGVYGPDLVDRWKGRAFQQNPDSEINLIGGFEEEQTNWEGNSALLGERTGPVRAMREVWGADSGTNVTKTEIFYRDAVLYRNRLRVHPIPPDGAYASWDYNAGVAAKYYNTIKPEGVDIDGINDDMGNIDGFPPNDPMRPLYFDVNDPTFNLPFATDFWEQVSGAQDYGSLVYFLQNKSPTSAENPIAMPYYRDDKCFDDGTGDNPVPHPDPGSPSFDAYPAGTPCEQRQGAYGTHGVHIFITGDTDNAFQSKPVTEIDAQQWQFAVPTEEPTNVGEPYAEVVRAPLRAVAAPQANTPAEQPTKVATSVENAGPATGQATDQITLAARVMADGEALCGKPLLFRFQSVDTQATTAGEGCIATDTRTVNGPAGETLLVVDFAGDDDYAPSSMHQPFEVTREGTSISFVAEHGKGKTVVMRATLTDIDSPAAVAGATVRFIADGIEKASAQTNGDGVAEATFDFPGPPGHTFRVAFDGDPTYLGSSAQAVFAPGAGASGSGSSP